MSVHLVVNQRVRGKTMSKPLLISCHLNYKDFITLAICLPITSLLLLLPSSVYRFRPYFLITKFIWSAVGRTAPYSLTHNFLITSILLTFTYKLRHLVICAFIYLFVISPTLELWMTYSSRWIPSVAFGSKNLSCKSFRVISKLLAHIFR